MAFGDHLLVERKRWFISYYHHGIDVGNDQVIHLATKKDAEVVETSLEEFLMGGKIEIWEYITFVDTLKSYHRDMQGDFGRPHQSLPYLDEDRIAEIDARIADPKRAVDVARKNMGRRGYNIYADNCEHFATYCKTGLAISFQSLLHKKNWDRIAERPFG